MMVAAHEAETTSEAERIGREWAAKWGVTPVTASYRISREKFGYVYSLPDGLLAPAELRVGWLKTAWSETEFYTLLGERLIWLRKIVEGVRE